MMKKYMVRRVLLKIGRIIIIASTKKISYDEKQLRTALHNIGR
jgi:hypothetical protein